MKGFKKYNIVLTIFVLLSALAAGGLYIFDASKYQYYIIALIALLSLLLGLLISNMIFYRQIRESAYQKQKLQLWNSISYRVKNAGETSFNEMPLGIILFNDDFVIEWANNYAKKIFSSELIERNFSNLDKDFADKVNRRIPEFEISIYEKVYHCEHMLRDHVIYLNDITNETNVINKYKERTMALGILNLDNLDLSMATIDAQNKALQMSHLIGILTDWCEEYNISIKGYTDERYMLIMDYKTLSNVMEKEFSVLASVKNYCDKEGLRITASIGVVCDDKSATELMKDAEVQLDLALSRGGNQAIVRRDGETLFFGAKSEAMESRTPSYIRVKTAEVIDLINKHNDVYIMAHKYMDADAFGSCLAASKLAQSCGKKAKIVFDEEFIDATVKEIYNSIKSTYANCLDALISSEVAYKKIKEKDLLILVDCQYQRLLMSEKVYKKAKHVAVIDHHRRNPDAISDYESLYTLPSASSAVELIVEMLEFVDQAKYEITQDEAMWMIMGIVVDTNNFMFHTTYRTFNVLAKLQRFGADMGKAQKYLRENSEEYMKKIEFLNGLEITKDGYGIITCDDGIYERAFIAKVADNAISVASVKAAFCIGRYEKNAINISARSLDEENVQVIMEKMGGGGHFGVAAAQLKDVTIDEVKQKLLSILESNKTVVVPTKKVILMKDVSGKGKINDIIELPLENANFLIRNDQAVEATRENVKKYEIDRLNALAQEEKELKEKQELKERIEAISMSLPCKVDSLGRLKKEVSIKKIIEAFNQENNLNLDYHKVVSEVDINALGTYKIRIQLHNEVEATITVYIIEDLNK